MLSQTVEYSLRAMVCLAENQTAMRTIEQLAQQTMVPAPYLAKVIKQLGKKGLLICKRGPQGGAKLARPAEEISILDIVQAVDQITRIEKCPLGLAQHATQLCPLHSKLDMVIADLLETFSTTSLANLIEDPNWPTPLCSKHKARLYTLS